MDKINKLILLAVHSSVCNFRCSYCYLAQRDEYYQNQQPCYQYSPEHVAQALSKERLGGTSYINICADGETLLTKDITKYVYHLLKEGHYVEFITNMTITNVLEEMLSWNQNLLKRLLFKCSFHYLELKEKGLLEIFANNVQKAWHAGASANIEITPHDELIPFLDEVKGFSLIHFGALPHITIARRDDTEEIGYLTNLSIEEYDGIWSQFDSGFWEFKKEIFMKKRTEFCYAGEWSLSVDIATGETGQCYASRFRQNIFEDLNKPIEFRAIGKCMLPHCYNGHSFLTVGCIKNFSDIRYGNIRNRIKSKGEEWLTKEALEFFNSKLEESNSAYSKLEENSILKKQKFHEWMRLPKRVARKLIGDRK
ncbi:MAG: radical SAM protein [Lachnospiraceae bacterium]